ncbi:unnamed protein product [Microthlaspi erraticum]|uniref:Uncharacterized protein n=1 Tax=Microthlaspi erraticum TaxID=1685480 RepID=A0A6D2IAW4_9BRAS|nr:unnamed protein product [Microthlaspi erraticum]
MKSSAIKVNKAVKCQLDQELESSRQSTSSIEFRDELRQTKLKLDRVEAWPVELRNSTGWSSGRSSWSSRWLLPSSFAYPVELLPCAKSLHAPHVFWSILEHMGHEEHGGTWHMEAAQLDTQRKKGEAILKTSSTVHSTNRSSSSTRPAKLQLDRAEVKVKPEKCCFPLDFL